MADGDIVIPQPLVVRVEGDSGGSSPIVPPYQNLNAMIGSIAITLYCNTDFNQAGGAEEAAKKCIANAEALYIAATNLKKRQYFDALMAYQ